jgi:integrase
MADSSAQSPENNASPAAGQPEEPPAPQPARRARPSPERAFGAPAAPAPTPLPGHLERLADRARDYAKASSAANTQRAYAADWRHYNAWARRQNLPALPPDPQVIGLYIAAEASGAADPSGEPRSVATIERRLSALAWNFAQRGQPMDRKDRHIATVLAGVRRTHARPPIQKEAVLPEDLLAMLATLGRGSLRDLRDRAILLLGFAGGLRRSEIVALDCDRDQTQDGAGWVEILEKGMVLTLRGKTGWREVEIGRGSSDATCPIVALATWLKFARIDHGPLFRRVIGEGKKVAPDRLADRHVARLVKRCALAAGLRPDLTLAEREEKYAGHSLRAGLASSAKVDERFVQKQLGHASPEMTRRYQRRRDRFRVNLTKAAGL